MSSKRPVTLGLVQMSCSADKEANIEKAVQMISEAASKGAQVVCLPELFTSPYFPQEEKSNAKEYAEEVPGPTTKILSAAAKENNVVLVGGSLYEKDGDKFYNTAVTFNETGKLLGKYRKVHIPHDPGFYEQNYFTPGDLGFKVYETAHGKVGTMICFDQWFPEAARANALLGAEIIFYPTAIGHPDDLDPKEGDWQKPWEDVQRGHAIANNVIVSAVNRVGRESDTDFYGGSFVIDQWGKTLVRASDKEEVLIATVDLDLQTHLRESWRLFYNRRPDTYTALTKK